MKRQERRPTIRPSQMCVFSTSSSQLQEVTMDRDNSSFMASPNCSLSGQGHTMKEYEEQLAGLRKENFNLKLRVYFLEERIDTFNVGPNQEDLFKKNVELKVSMESLRRELDEKRDLLCAAGKALELFESTAAKKEEELNLYISYLEDELKEAKRDNLNNQTDHLSDATTVSVADNSVALYAAAFNIKPKGTNKPAHSEPCEEENRLVEECEKLKTMLAEEREIGAKLRETVASKDQLIYEQSIKLKALPEPDAMKGSGDSAMMEKLQQENVNACKMIQSCLVHIKQMDKEAKKLKISLGKKDESIATLKDQLRKAEAHGAAESSSTDIGITTTDADIAHELKTSIPKSKVENSQKNDNTSDEKEYDWMNTQLENKIKSLHQCVKDDVQSSQGNVQEVLTNRLQELAYFLDSLLHHKCVLESDKRRKVEKLLEQSLDLTSCLTLDSNASKLLEQPSLLDWTLDRTSDQSQSLRLENLTKIFGHHFSINDSDSSKPIHKKKESKKSNEEMVALQNDLRQQDELIEQLYDRLKTVKSKCICASSAEEDNDEELVSLALNRRTLRKRQTKPSRNNKSLLNGTWHGTNNPNDQSESECWSEPDRNVSLERMGGPLETKVDWQPTSEDDCTDRQTPTNKSYINNSKLISEYDKKVRMLTEEKMQVEKLLSEANDKLVKLHSELEVAKYHHNLDVKEKQELIDCLMQKLEQGEKALKEATFKHEDYKKEAKINHARIEGQLMSAEVQIEELKDSIKMEKERHLKQEKRDADYVSKTRYDALRKEVDQAALQASQATLDRTVAIEQRMRSEADVERLNKSLSQAKLKVSELESYCAELTQKITHLETWQRQPSRTPSSHSHSPRASSPDQGIDSDRLSSLEIIESVPTVEHYSDDLAAENTMLREKLERTQKKLEYAVSQLSAANNIKKKMNRSICQQIHKTTSVLRQVRDNLTGDDS